MPGQVPGGTRSAGTGAVLDRSLLFGCAAWCHIKIGGTQYAFQILGSAFGALHLHLVVIGAHYQNFDIFLALQAFKFIDWHHQLLKMKI
jgi:hypothetical protein